LAERDLSVDLLIGAEQFPEAIRIAQAFPSLRIIVDHCCNVPVRQPLPEAWIFAVRAARRHPNLIMKVSGLVEGTGRSDGTAPREVDAYRFILDPSPTPSEKTAWSSAAIGLSANASPHWPLSSASWTTISPVMGPPPDPSSSPGTPAASTSVPQPQPSGPDTIPTSPEFPTPTTSDSHE
jgi:hypothetical protein